MLQILLRNHDCRGQTCHCSQRSTSSGVWTNFGIAQNICVDEGLLIWWEKSDFKPKIQNLRKKKKWGRRDQSSAWFSACG